MKKIYKLLKATAVFLSVIAFCLTFIYIPAGGNLYAAGGKIKVYIDAGHGGMDPGAVRFGLNEKDANLDIALRLKSKLEANGFEVVMTRTNDAYSTLDERVEKANSSGADIFLSVHNNAALSEYAHGTETYWCANGVTGSSQLAGYIQNNLVKQISRANRGVKTANFRVIKNTRMPAALVECAFVSNPTEAELLKTSEFKEKIVLGLYNGIVAFAKGLDRSSESSSSESSSSGSSSSESSGSSSENYSDSSGKETTGFTVKVLEPENDSVIKEDFVINGWAADVKNSPPLELAKVEFYKGQERNEENLLGSITSFKDNILGATGLVNGGWSETIEISKLDEGENIIYVYAYDKKNNYSFAYVKVNMIKGTEENVVPIADAGGPYNALVDEEITFDGSGSTDSDGEIVEYTWNFGDEETGSEVSPVHAYTEAGEYTVTLTVKDDKDALSEEVTATVTVEEEEENAVPVADAGGPYNALVDEEITFDGSGSTDSDGEIVEYTWNFGDESTGSGVNPVHAYTEVGEYTVTLTVKDDSDTLSEEVTTTVTVEEEEENAVPVADAGGPYNGAVDEEITFDGSGSTDSDGEIVEYTWNFGDESTGSEVSPVHTYTEVGEYTVTLTVKDDGDALSEEATTTVTIEEEAATDDGGGDESEGDNKNTEEVQQTVTAIAEEDKTALVDDKLTFDATGSTVSPLEEDTVITYSWDWDGDGTYDETVEEPVTTHTYNKAGVYEVTLKVAAFDDVSSTDTVTVTINKPNEIPVANPGGPYTATAGKELTLDGSGSIDSDGTIKEYIWDFGDKSTGSGINPVHTYAKAGEYTVTLTVKDDKKAASKAATTKVTVKEAEKTYSVSTSPITNSTNVIGYTEVTADQLVKLFIDRGSSSAIIERAKRIAPLYIKYGKEFNLRADIAWAMMCHETGFLEYTGDVSPDQNNFCGLGAIGGGVPGNSFATEELGVIAHYAHLAWYYYPDHVNVYCSINYDPRHSSTHWRYTGDTTLGFLNGQWAPGETYTSKIIEFANKIYGF
jgi:N-acetylmuramoyl-L-alanine amidase/PKD repeat protein